MSFEKKKNISPKTFSGKFLNHFNSRAIDFSRINIRLLTKQGALKYETDCAPNNGYYFVPVYEKGEYRLQVEGVESTYWLSRKENENLLILFQFVIQHG
jgi:hypothetical protein